MIPDYQSLMLPLLKFIGDGQSYNSQSLINHLAQVFNLSEEELNEFVPSGQQKVFANRISWAKSHLKMSGAIENLTKGIIRITDRGKLILSQNPSEINYNVYEWYPSWCLRYRLQWCAPSLPTHLTKMICQRWAAR